MWSAAVCSWPAGWEAGEIPGTAPATVRKVRFDNQPWEEEPGRCRNQVQTPSSQETSLNVKPRVAVGLVPDAILAPRTGLFVIRPSNAAGRRRLK